MVPDPERTHLGHYFDRFLEAIILAADEENFGYDRYWLPWHVSHDPANPHLADQDILDGRAEERHRKPGVIIFRDSSSPRCRRFGDPIIHFSFRSRCYSLLLTRPETGICE